MYKGGGGRAGGEVSEGVVQRRDIVGVSSGVVVPRRSGASWGAVVAMGVAVVQYDRWVVARSGSALSHRRARVCDHVLTHHRVTVRNASCDTELVDYAMAPNSS